MAKTFRCSIVTPVASVFDDEVTYASFPAWDGQQGMMPGRSPLLTRLGIGSLRLDSAEGGSRWFFIDGGFAQVQGNTITLLTEGAAPAESLSLSQAEAEMNEANAKIAQAGKDYPAVQRQQQRALAKRALASNHAGRGGAI